MAPSPYSFIDIAVLEEVRARFAAGDALAILTVDLDEVIWANGAGAALLGYSDIEAVMGATPGLGLAAQRQIAATPGFPHRVKDRSVMVRLARGVTSRAVPFLVSSIAMPDGAPAILLAVAASAPGPLDRDEIPARIIEGFREAGYFAALIDADARISTASAGFSELGITDSTLARLVDEVGHERDRLVKRRVPAGDGLIPAGIARLTDDPPLHLLIAINDPVEEQIEAEAETPVTVATIAETAMDEVPEPSDSDLFERVEEDGAAKAERLQQQQEEARASESDDWYFGSGAKQARAQERQVTAPRPDFTGAAPVRFIWRTDADGAFSTISDEFLTATGHDAANLIGRPFREVADEFGLDPSGEITGLLERRDTWSGRSVLWPVAGTELRVPVDLAALPTYSRDRTFEGFRGFGVVRPAEAVAAPVEPVVETDTPAPAAGSEQPRDPFQGEVPVISIAEKRDRRASDKVIKLAEHRPAPTPSAPPSSAPPARQLSPGERTAFEEIRARLRQDYAAARTDDQDAKEPAPEQQEQPAAELAPVPDQQVQAPAPVEPEAPAIIAPPAPPARTAPPIMAANFTPSAFFQPKSEAGIDADFLAALPLPVLVHAGDELYFANREFLALTGYASLAQIQREGGLDRLFVDNEPVAPASEAERKPRLRTLGGEEFPVDAHLQSIRWGERAALMLAVQRIEPMAVPAARIETATPAAIVAPPSLDTQELEGRVAEMRTIIDTATDGVILITPEGTIRSISRPAEALFGFDSATVEGDPFTTLFAIESQKAARDYLDGLADNGVASVLNDGREVIGREAEGRFIPLFMTIGRLPGSSGYCAVMRDITQWKRAEEELTQARALAERASSQKTEFLARVSHEIRTPLNAIIGFSELMLDEKFGPIGSDRHRDYLRDINRSGNHVLDLVNDLLDISKIEAGEQEMDYQAVSLNDALAESVAMMQPQANRNRVIIRSSLASRLPEVVADLRSVRQIALNLLSNAIRYTQAGGQVIVSTSYEPSGEVMMRVRDTGIGMTLSEIDQALKPFKQINALKRGHHDGTGLGLPLTKAMVEANRARFTIASTPGDGTLVEIAFPSTRVLAE